MTTHMRASAGDGSIGTRARTRLSRAGVAVAVLAPLFIFHFPFFISHFSLGAQAQAERQYDLLLRGGHVIDPRNGVDTIRDVAIRKGVIAAVEPRIDPPTAAQTVEVTGLYVTPGLVDIHTHVYTGTGEPNSYAGDNSVYPDGFTFRVGVTTVVDAGGSGWRNFDDFNQRIIERSKTRVLAFLNIVGIGTAHFTGPEWAPVERAVQAGTLADIPVMVDFGANRPERPLAELVTKKLRPGDIYTHVYSGLRGELASPGHL